MAEQGMKDVVLILLDISGYTRFMVDNRETLVHSQVILGELMTAIVQNVKIPLQVAKLEGDAVFLYIEKPADPAQWADMQARIGEELLLFLDVFRQKLDELVRSSACKCGACKGIDQLRLKIIVHSGRIVLVAIDRFVELSGEDVIVAHRLLKNSVQQREYILVTEAAARDLTLPESLPFSPLDESYPDLGDIRTRVYFPDDAAEGAPEQESTRKRASFAAIFRAQMRLVLKSLAIMLRLKKPGPFRNLPSLD